MSEIKTGVQNYYLSHHDAVNYLNNTIVLYDNRPCLIEIYDDGDGLEVRLKSPVTGSQIAEISLQDLVIDTPELGYINFETPYNPHKIQVLYLTRTTGKKYRQGLCSSNIYTINLNGENVGMHVLNSQAFEDSILGKYPKLSEVMPLLLEKKLYEVAISKNIALQKIGAGVIVVNYRQDEIGYITKNDPTTIITPSRKHSWVIEKYLSGMNWKLRKD